MPEWVLSQNCDDVKVDLHAIIMCALCRNVDQWAMLTCI